jgi:cytochrome c oxidase subunit 4
MEQVQRPHANYWAIWVYLAVLTAVELWVVTLGWSQTTSILVLLFLAVWKALLVALYFMHLKYEGRQLRIMVVAPLPLAVILVVAVIQEFR